MEGISLKELNWNRNEYSVEGSLASMRDSGFQGGVGGNNVTVGRILTESFSCSQERTS